LLNVSSILLNGSISKFFWFPSWGISITDSKSNQQEE
jgi:hypothetical protein